MIESIEKIQNSALKSEGIRTKDNELFRIVDDYKKLIKIIKDNTNTIGICMMKKTEIAGIYGLSYSGTLKKLNYLIRYSILLDCKPGLIVSGKCVVLDTPIALTLKLLRLLQQSPELRDSYKKQAESLNVPIHDIRVAWGFLSHCYGSKYGPPVNDG